MTEVDPSFDDDVLCWAHFGDLHLSDAEAANARDLATLVAQANARLVKGVDFVYPPGDVAEHGAEREYALALEALADLRLPYHVVPGDHDMHPGHLAAFRRAFSRTPPYALRMQGRACIFLDLVSNGTGGPDFRLGKAQCDWLGQELARADGEGGAIVFMHAYPADLDDPGERAFVTDLFRRRRVLAVDMGHTHYNELANDGRTIFAATRSTGQIKEGPVGFSLCAIDPEGRVSWRFKTLASA